MIYVKMSGDDVEAKMQHEHVNAASILDGYRRTLLYRPAEQSPDSPYVVMLHEFESLDSRNLPYVKKEMESIGATEDCSFQLRSFQLLESEGFAGECRKPQRL